MTLHGQEDAALSDIDLAAEAEILNYPSHLHGIDPVVDFSFQEMSTIVERFSSSADALHLINHLIDHLASDDTHTTIDSTLLQDVINLLRGEVDLIGFSNATRSSIIII
ncbi:hypothetical protein [uncultured Tateyamaria sp.]|uniref:hypothetical protein n=1 Tax=uncultured Tateyamaria sp. TaxID=455651 RepID=UPI0026071F07|nr:hypothetical protein [uncultured Tateyamaria sp.]